MNPTIFVVGCRKISPAILAPRRNVGGQQELCSLPQQCQGQKASDRRIFKASKSNRSSAFRQFCSNFRLFSYSAFGGFSLNHVSDDVCTVHEGAPLARMSQSFYRPQSHQFYHFDSLYRFIPLKHYLSYLILFILNLCHGVQAFLLDSHTRVLRWSESIPTTSHSDQQ